MIRLGWVHVGVCQRIGRIEDIEYQVGLSQ